MKREELASTLAVEWNEEEYKSEVYSTQLVDWLGTGGSEEEEKFNNDSDVLIIMYFIDLVMYLHIQLGYMFLNHDLSYSFLYDNSQWLAWCHIEDMFVR